MVVLSVVGKQDTMNGNLLVASDRFRESVPVAKVLTLLGWISRGRQKLRDNAKLRGGLVVESAESAKRAPSFA